MHNIHTRPHVICPIPVVWHIPSCFWQNQQDVAYLGRVEDTGETWVSFPSLPPSHHPLCVGTDHQKVKGLMGQSIWKWDGWKTYDPPLLLGTKLSYPPVHEGWKLHNPPRMKHEFFGALSGKITSWCEIILYILDLHEFLNKLWYKIIWK